MATQENVQTITINAGGDLSSSQYRFVVIATDGKVDEVGSAGADATGVLLNAPDEVDKAATVAISGVVKIVTGSDTMVPGMKCQSDANGEVIEAASADHVLGIALTDSVVGELCSVLLGSNHLLA